MFSSISFCNMLLHYHHHFYFLLDALCLKILYWRFPLVQGRQLLYISNIVKIGVGVLRQTPLFKAYLLLYVQFLVRHPELFGALIIRGSSQQFFSFFSFLVDLNCMNSGVAQHSYMT